MATPTPLPVFDEEALKPEDPERAIRSLGTTLKNLLIYLARTRDVLFDTSATDSLGSQLAGLTEQITALSGAVRHIYVIPIGTPVVSDPGLPGLPRLDGVTGTIVEFRVRNQQPASGDVALAVTVDGVVVAGLLVISGATVASVTASVAITQNQQLGVVVQAAPTDAGSDWVAQIRCR